MTLNVEPAPFRVALGKRLQGVMDRFSSKAMAAKAAGVTLEQFNKWIAGGSKVPLESLHFLANAANISFAWLATGEGSMYGNAATNPNGSVYISKRAWKKLKRVIKHTDNICQQKGIEIIPERRADLYQALYKLTVEKKAKRKEEISQQHLLVEDSEDDDEDIDEDFTNIINLARK